MNHSIRIRDLAPYHCNLEPCSQEDSFVIEFDKAGGQLLLQNVQEKLDCIDWSKAKYIILDVTNLEQWVIGISFKFYKHKEIAEAPDMEIVMGTLPHIKTRLALPIEALNSQKLFLERTPGKLKTVVFGNKVRINEIYAFSVGTSGSFRNQRLQISDLHISCEEPDYSLPDVLLSDELGQLCTKDWPGKTHGVEELKEYLAAEADREASPDVSGHLSRYGGWKEKSFEATGYFRTQFDGKRWWLVDPEGYAFFSSGLDVVYPGEAGRVDTIESFFKWLPEAEGPFEEAWYIRKAFDGGKYFNFGVANLIRAFGDSWKEKWTRLTLRRMSDWGFNTVGNWSQIDFIRQAKLPYVWPLKNFPSTARKVFRDFPDVFSAEYQDNADRFALQLEALKDDRCMIGYFLRNEPQWAFIEDLNIAEELLENNEALVSKEILIQFLSKRYSGDVGALNAAWKTSLKSFDELRKGISRASLLSASASADLTDFSKIMIEEYVKIPSQSAKKVDPHHLNLGMRYAYIKNDVLYSGCNNFDVFSFNCYKMSPAFEAMKIGEKTGLPVMVGEFHFGALDRGLLTMGLRGVPTQEERGKAYRYYMESGAENPYFVGAHYFILNDQPVLGRFDGENFQVGCVDVCHKPYEEFVKYLSDTNRTIYEVADGRRRKSPDIPIEIKTNAF